MKMKNLTIQKLTLGLLMAFVLVVGVQGIADAVDPPNAQGEATIITPINIGSAVTYTNAFTQTIDGEVETVTISRSSGITFTGADGNKSSVSLKESGEGTIASGPSAIFTAAGRQAITIRSKNASGNWTFVYVYYVVDPDPPSSATVSLTSFNKSGYRDAYYGVPLRIHSGSGHYSVTYATAVDLEVRLPSADTTYLADTDDGIVDLPSDGTISSALDVYLKAQSVADPVTKTVTATLNRSSGADVSIAGAYIYGTPKFTVTPSTTVSNEGARLQNAITVKVVDGKTTGANVAGVLVKFTVQDTSQAGGTLAYPPTTDAGTLVGADNRQLLNTNGTLKNTDTGKTLHVRTDSSGNAAVDFLLGNAVEQKVTVTAIGRTETVSLFTQSVSGLKLGTPEITQRSGSSGLYDLYVPVEDDGERVGVGYAVEFSTSQGTLKNTPTGSTADPATDTATATAVTEKTDPRGIAYVVYDPKGNSGNLRVTASIKDQTVAGGTSTLADPEVIADQLVLTVRGGSNNQQQNQQNQQNQQTEAAPSSLRTVSGTDQSGETGAALSNPFVVELLNTNGQGIDNVQVNFEVVSGGGTLSASSDSTDSSGRAETTLTLGSAAGTNTVRASVSITGFSISPVTFTATASEPDAPVSALEIDSEGNQRGEVNNRLADDLTVRVVDANDNGVPFELVRFRIVEGRGRLTSARDTTDSAGYAAVGFTPLSSGTIEVEATSGDLDPVTFTITTGEPPADVLKVSGDNQSGSPGSRLANPLVVEVVDENDDPVSGASVTFAVTAGGGSLSVTSVTTNGTGRAETYLRLGDEVGENTVRASVAGLTAITFTARSGAEVLVNAAQRPPVYWVDRTNGTLHRLVGDDVEALAPNIDGILGLTVDTRNGLLYWTRQTAQSKSAIQRAGLNGRGVITLQTSLTLMTSIAVNSTGTTIYWADILGKLKSRPVQGNKVTLLAQNLSSPTGLVWANDYLYWGEATGHIRRMNLRNNRRTIETITRSSGEPVSLAVHSGRVYWTEISGNASQLNRVNTNGTGLEALKTLTGLKRVWIAVDGLDSKIYLTRLTKLERRGLSGGSAKTLVSGLQSPGSLVLGGELAAAPVVSQPTQPTQPTQPADNAKYDVNGDGTVDLLDVFAPILQPTNMKNDVNGDGVVDIRDSQEIDANRDAAAAAPSLDIDVKSLDFDFDRVQEQVEVLLASGDMSHSTQRALLYLQHLLASARPDETVLLANYPNPFNPETWIPYHLAESTDVKIHIYDAQGTLVRVLVLGHQTAGYYTSRSRAAYWDGKNAIGERVASGIYFYQLETDETSPMRKMVILK